MSLLLLFGKYVLETSPRIDAHAEDRFSPNSKSRANPMANWRVSVKARDEVIKSSKR